jgi:hypothetical protein
MQNTFHVSLHFPHGFTKAHIKEPTHPSQLSATLVFPKLSRCSEDNPTQTNLDKDIQSVTRLTTVTKVPAFTSTKNSTKKCTTGDRKTWESLQSTITCAQSLSFKWLQSIPCFAWCQASLSFHLVSSQQGTPHLGCLVHIARPVRTNMSKVRVASMKEMARKLV